MRKYILFLACERLNQRWDQSHRQHGHWWDV